MIKFRAIRKMTVIFTHVISSLECRHEPLKVSFGMEVVGEKTEADVGLLVVVVVEAVVVKVVEAAVVILGNLVA